MPVLTHTAGVETLFIVTGALFGAATVYAALIPMGEEPSFRTTLRGRDGEASAMHGRS